jgi:nitroreductase
VDRLPDPDGSCHIASITFSRRAPLHHDVDLAAAIARRRTDRRRYSSWPVPEAHLVALIRSAAAEGVVVERVSMSSVFRKAAAKAAEIHAHDSRYQAELAAWNTDDRSTDGIPSANVPSAHLSSPLGSMSLPNRSFPRRNLERAPLAGPSEDAGTLLLVGTPGDDRASRIRAGEATGDVLLEATAMGLATSVYTEPLESAESRRSIQQQVSTTHCFPQVIVRTGWAPVDAPPIPPTPRRPLGDVLQNVVVDPPRSSPDSTTASL